MLSFFSKIRNTVKPATYDHWLVSAVGFHSKQVTRGNILKRLSHFSTTNILDRSSFKGELSATSWPQYFVWCLSVCINSFSMILTRTFLPSGFNKIREWPPRWTQEPSTFIKGFVCLQHCCNNPQVHAESSSCFPLHNRLMEIRTNVILHRTEWRITFLPFPDPVSSLSCLSSRQSSPPSFRPPLYVETILDKYRSQHIITTKQLYHNTVQHCFNICSRGQAQIYIHTNTQPTFRSVYQHRYRAAMEHFTPNV